MKTSSCPPRWQPDPTASTLPRIVQGGAEAKPREKPATEHQEPNGYPTDAERMEAIENSPIVGVREFIMTNLGSFVVEETSETYIRDRESRKITIPKVSVDLHDMNKAREFLGVVEVLLHNNFVNRPISPPNVRYFCREILKGEWKNGLAPIKFAIWKARIVLIAGQHRLYGIRQAVKQILMDPEMAGPINDPLQLDLAFGHHIDDAFYDNVVKPSTAAQLGRIDQKINETEDYARTPDFAIATVLIDGPGVAAKSQLRNAPERMELLRPLLKEIRHTGKVNGIKGAITPVKAVLLRWIVQPNFDGVAFNRFIEALRTSMTEEPREQIAVVLKEFLAVLHDSHAKGVKVKGGITRTEQWVKAYNITELAVDYYRRNASAKTALGAIRAEVNRGGRWRSELLPHPSFPYGKESEQH